MPRLTRVFLLALAGLVPLACTDDATDRLLAPDGPSAAFHDAEGITVMTQNLYLGANIDLLLAAEDAGDVGMVFQQLTTTSAGQFGRARQLALQIALERPHLVGLQEVTTYTFETAAGAQTLDFLEVLQAYLDYFHYLMPLTPYTYTAIRNDLTGVTFPASAFGSFPDVTYEDADAILVRSDVDLLGDPDLVTYEARQIFSVAGTAFPNLRGYQAVTARVNGEVIHFVNTHLEVQMFEPVQLLQTAELIAAMEEIDVPVVMVGDFNSAANHDAPEDQKTESYHMFRQAGFADLWLREPHSVGGVTCCQAADLTNPESELTQRLDLVLVRYGNAGFGGQSVTEVVGEEPGDRITVEDPVLGELTLWPSDHAGVVATFWPAPGLRKKFPD